MEKNMQKRKVKIQSIMKIKKIIVESKRNNIKEYKVGQETLNRL